MDEKIYDFKVNIAIEQFFTDIGYDSIFAITKAVKMSESKALILFKKIQNLIFLEIGEKFDGGLKDTGSRI